MQFIFRLKSWPKEIFTIKRGKSYRNVVLGRYIIHIKCYVHTISTKCTYH